MTFFPARKGRVVLCCLSCGKPMATLSEQQLHKGAALTPFRGKSSAALLEKIAELAHAICCSCETAALRSEHAPRI